MANEKNLIRRTSSEAREIGRKGGIASGKRRAERKTLKEELLALLSDPDVQNRISVAMIEKAASGDVRAFEVIRDTIGEKPVDRQEIVNSEIVVTIEE